MQQTTSGPRQPRFRVLSIHPSMKEHSIFPRMESGWFMRDVIFLMAMAVAISISLF
jgi:hypothetical protein